jgi:DNA primase
MKASVPVKPSLTAMFGGKIHCPFHADKTPSLMVYDDENGGHVHCFGCGAHHDLIDYVMMVEDVDRNEAERLLAEGAYKDRQHRRGPDEIAATLKFAEQLWNEGKAIAGTLAARYLSEVRGIDLNTLPAEIDETLRYHPNCPFASGVNYPCLLARYSDVLSDEFAGLHRIAVTPKVFAGAKVQRKTLGQWDRSKAIKLWKPNGHLYVAEGVETALAAACMKATPVWAAGCAANMAALPVLELEVCLLVDRDPSRTGELKSFECSQRYAAAGRKITRRQPKAPHKDFNDLWLERRRAGT